MKTAACYVRVSTDDQLEFSPDSQLKAIKDYAKKHDIELLPDYIFIEDGGKSGKSMAKRTEFMRLVSLAVQKQKFFDIILVWKFSRFARNQEESIVLKSKLKKKGIEVISVSEPLPDGPYGSLVERIVEWTDEFYLTNLSGEVKRGMKERFSRGLPVNNPPAGYKMENGNFTPSEDAHFIRGIFADFLCGMKLQAIARKYADMGLKTTRGNTPDRRFFEYVLRNPVYCGKLRMSAGDKSISSRHYTDVVLIDGGFEPIVSVEAFEQAQAKLDELKRQYPKYSRPDAPVPYMLKGLVRCSSCGGTLVRSGRPEFPVLQCHNYAASRECKVSHSVGMEKAEQAVISYLSDVLQDSAAKINFVEPPESKTSEEDLRKSLKAEMARLDRIKAAYINGIDTLEEYQQNKARQLGVIRRIKEEMDSDAVKKKVDMKPFRDKLSSVLDVLHDPQQPADIKNAALRTIIERIIFDRKAYVFVVYFYI